MVRSLLLLATALAVGVAGTAVLWRRWIDPAPPATASGSVRVEVAGRGLRLPAEAIRFAEQRSPGVHPRIDLALLAPDWVGRTAANAERFDVLGQAPDVVWLTLQAANGDPDSAGLLATVHHRLFVGEPLAPIAGLEGRNLSSRAGYVGEEVWFEPGAVRPFAARCFPLLAEGPVTTCLHTETRDGLAVVWRFPKPMLAEWRALRDGLDGRLAAWGVPDRR